MNSEPRFTVQVAGMVPPRVTPAANESGGVVAAKLMLDGAFEDGDAATAIREAANVVPVTKPEPTCQPTNLPEVLSPLRWHSSSHEPLNAVAEVTVIDAAAAE